MSNKPKGVAIHPNNILSKKEKAYNMFIHQAVVWAKKFAYSKHIGSKCPRLNKLMMNH